MFDGFADALIALEADAKPLRIPNADEPVPDDAPLGAPPA